ncbi:MAG: hypothetical protein PHX08_05745 [Lachnospiraceae bacterium]|nr:hypothetical protein [Lachnospiraceae bacterium]
MKKTLYCFLVLSGVKMNLLIIGAGSFSTEIEEMAQLLGYDDIAFIDDNPEKAISSPVLGTMKAIKEFTSHYQSAIVAMGNNKNRLYYHNILEELNFNIPVLVHPMAYVSPDAKVAPGCIIRIFAVIGRYAELGKTTILNIGAKVDHHCKIGEGSHLLINSVVRGSKTVEPLTWLDAGKVIE